jgi:CheY-like chemotaxis protein
MLLGDPLGAVLVTVTVTLPVRLGGYAFGYRRVLLEVANAVVGTCFNSRYSAFDIRVLVQRGYVTGMEEASVSKGVVDFSATTVAPYGAVVIDGTMFERRLLRAWLESSGHFMVVGEARDGEDGVPLVAALRPQLVVLELSMPRPHGIEVLMRLVALSPRPVVVIFSGLLSVDLGGALGRLGAAACFDKNFGFASLTDQLVRVVETSLPRPLNRQLWAASDQVGLSHAFSHPFQAF